MQIKVNRELAVGLAFTAIGLLFLYFGKGYAIGTALSMGPGFLPFYLSLALIVLGIIQFFRAWRTQDKVSLDLFRPSVVAIAVAGFAYLLPHIGAVIGSGLVMLAVGLLHPKFSWKAWAISYAVVIVLILIFKFLLGSTIPLWI